MNEKYICDDRPIEIPEKFINMTDEEIEDEFEKRFADFTEKPPTVK